MIRPFRSKLVKVSSILNDLVWAKEHPYSSAREKAYNKFNSLITELQIPTENPDVEALRLEAVIEEGIAKAKLFLD